MIVCIEISQQICWGMMTVENLPKNRCSTINEKSAQLGSICLLHRAYQGWRGSSSHLNPTSKGEGIQLHLHEVKNIFFLFLCNTLSKCKPFLARAFSHGVACCAIEKNAIEKTHFPWVLAWSRLPTLMTMEFGLGCYSFSSGTLHALRSC